MAEVTRYAPGTFCWIDLATPDTAAAKSFYGGLFGWTAEDRPGSGGSGGVYSILKLGGREVGALWQFDAGMAGMTPTATLRSPE